jgi:hypothetical protein
VTAIERLAGMQAQYSPSPYIGLWTRLRDFRREHLEDAVRADLVLKCTLMRGTLHLVSGREYALFRAATRNPYHVGVVGRLRKAGVDTELIRREILEAVAAGPLGRAEIARLTQHHVPDGVNFWGGWSAVAVAGDLVNLREDALYGYFGGSRYRPAPAEPADREVALRHLLRAYLSAFGPATRADLAQWSGQVVGVFAGAIRDLDLVELPGKLLDLADAPRPPADTPAPVRFLPKWDNLLLAYARRERVLPEPYRGTVIRKNGDVLPTFLVDGFVAGTWAVQRAQGRATVSLSPFGRMPAATRRALVEEAERLAGFLA